MNAPSGSEVVLTLTLSKILSESGAEPVPDRVSVTVIVRLEVPDWFGVPVIAPVAGSILAHPGNPVALHV